MQEANVTGVKGYPMLSSQTTNKEAMKYKKWYPIKKKDYKYTIRLYDNC